MTIGLAPNAAQSSTPPAVGIFWCVDGIVVIDRSTLKTAEPNGDCLTHAAGHYERWLEWQLLGAPRLRALGFPEAIATTEYDDWPRGRIVYEVVLRRFVLYADRRLQKPVIIAALKGAFGPGDAEVVVRSDPHYR